MFQKFYPDYYANSSYEIDYEELYRLGYRGLIFDIDNTLVEHGAHANDRVVALFDRLKKIGFQICLMSNNKKKRVSSFNEVAQVEYIYNAHKPSRKGYVLAMEKMHTDVKTTVFVGDQLFTDVWGAKRMGIRNYLVKQIGPKEEIQIVLKRYLERIVLHFYFKQK